MPTQRETPQQSPASSDERIHRERGRLRREEILLEAANQFSQRGLSAVTVEDIAKEVGCNKSLVYYYFGSKDGLRDAVMAKVVDVTRQMWAQLGSRSFAEWVSDVTDWPGDNPDSPWLRLIVREGISDTGRAVLEEERARALVESTRVVVRAQGSGEVEPELDPELVALLVLFLTMGPVTVPQLVRMITHDPPESDRFHERYSAFIQTLLHRLAPAPRD